MICFHSNFYQLQDLVYKIVKIKAAAFFSLGFMIFHIWVNIAVHADSMTRCVGSFQIPFLWSCALSVEETSLPRNATSVSGWLTGVHNVIILWKSTCSKFYSGVHNVIILWKRAFARFYSGVQNVIILWKSTCSKFYSGVHDVIILWKRAFARFYSGVQNVIILWKSTCHHYLIIYPLVARVVGALQMILQPVFLHFSLFSTALWDLPNSRPFHSLMLSSHLFLCLPCLLPPFTMPCKMVLARPDEWETWPYHCSLLLYDRHEVFMWSNWPAGSWHGLPRW